MSQSSQEKTEQATPRRLQEARRKGQVAKSADLNGAVLLLIAGLFALLYKDTMTTKTQMYLYTHFNNFVMFHVPENRLPQILMEFALNTFIAFLPFYIVLVVVALGINLAQVGFMFAPEAIKPKGERLNPISGMKRIFSTRSLFELAKSLLKVTIIGLVVYAGLKGELPNLLAIFHSPPRTVLNQVLTVALKIVLWGAAVYFCISILDLMYQRYAFRKEMRMSKQEVKDEYKQTEGDPQIKGWLRRRQRQLMANLVRKEVPKATVVVTNPTRFAVALKYSPDLEAPLVVAKGTEQLAKYIREVAKENNVPIIENVEVARFLYANVEVGQAIPMEMYQAVAEILAMVFRLKEKGYH